MTTSTVHVAAYDSFADWETGYVTAGINRPLWHKTPGRFRIEMVGSSLDPITTIGGMRIQPTSVLADLRPEDSAMLVLPGNDLWATPRYDPWLEKAREFRAAGVPVAAICGATGGLARAGMLDDRAHTSNAKAFLESIEGYRGSEHYRDEPAVDDDGLITGAAQAPVDFARAIFARLEVFEPSVLDSWFKLYGRQDPAGFYELMSA